MFKSYRYQPLLLLNLRAIINIQFHKTSQFLPYSLNFCTTTASESNPFVVSYLIDNIGLSPQSALQASKRLHFKTTENPDSVIAFLKSQGFSHSQMSSTIRKQPQLLVIKTKRLSPKFEFLASKGASTSDIIRIVTRNPMFATSSLNKNIIPIYEIVRGFSQSDEQAVHCLVYCPYLFKGTRLAQNVKLLLDEGVTPKSMCHFFRSRVGVLVSFDLKKTVDEVKELGFDPSSVKFAIALIAKRTVVKSFWVAKIDTLKSWGWSEESIAEAFRRQPLFMLNSKDKINKVMRLWVDELGWNPLALVMRPGIFGYSLERRVIPRAFVVQYLFERGLIDKNLNNICTPFFKSEKGFLQTWVEPFIEERSQLLKIYVEKMNLQDQDNRE